MKINKVLKIPYIYFSGVKNGDITVLFFEKAQLDGVKKGDLIEVSNINEKIKMYFDSARLMIFKDVDDELAKEAGFATRDLLANHLYERFNSTAFLLENTFNRDE